MKPNHVCKNAHCPHGVNGEPKHYYACNYCDKANQWRSMACCIECYDEYMKQIVEARAANKKVNLLPERTDMTQEEVQELLEQPIEEVLEQTKEELKDYLDEGNTVAEAIEQINDEIDNGKKKKRSSQKRYSDE